MLRRLEVWLHQHIFKVGWLTTKDFHTTTILYYTFFLPGVVLHQLVYWLAAGLVNVRADHTFKWPEAQEIGELKLNFIQLPRNVPALRMAFISAAPLVIGFSVVWFVANRIFDVPSILATISSGSMADVGAGLRQLTLAPDFWLWFYAAFTISNTMMPDWDKFQGIRPLLIIVAVASTIFVLIGVGNEIVVTFLTGPLANILNGLSGIFAVVIVMNIFAVGLLSLVENTIEWMTGDSADFHNGKMVVMTREERQSQRQRELDRQRRDRQRRKEATASTREALSSGPPSIYQRTLPIPEGPDKVTVTPVQQIVINQDNKPTKQPPLFSEARAGASQIEGQLQGDESRQVAKPPERPQLPPRKLPEQDDDRN